MNCERLFARIDELNGEYLDILEDICNIESPTDFKEGVDEVGKYLSDFAKNKGWLVEKREMENAGDAICITLNSDVKAAPVAFSGHIDTVHPVGLFGKPAVKRDETKMYGPGTTDCKGGVAAALLAMAALEDCGYTSRPVKLIIQTDEEVSSKYSGKKTIEFMCEKAKDAVAFLNCEGHGKGALILTRKGILRVDFHIAGIAGHSAVCFNAANAIAEAAYKIIELEKMKDSEGLTCNCGVISGGTVANSVAESCDFVADIRFSTEEELEKLRNIIKTVSENNTIKGCTCTVTERSLRPEMPASDKNYALLEASNRFFAENGLPVLAARHGHGGSDAAYTTKAGIPTLDSIGVMGDGIHSKNEYVLLDSVADAAKRLACIAYCI